VVNRPPREFQESGALLQNRLGPAQYRVTVGGLTSVGAPKGSVPEALRSLEAALSAQVRDEIGSLSSDGLTSVRRVVESGFWQSYDPAHEQFSRTALVETGQPVSFMLAADGLPRCGSPGPKPFVLGLPVLSLPGSRMSVGGSWSSPMAVVRDLTTREIVLVDARHRISGFDWFEDRPCAVIESTWETSGPLKAILGERAFTFSDVKTTGKRTSLFDYARGEFVSAHEQIENRITLSGGELQAVVAFSPGKVVKVSDATFEQEVLRSSLPVLVAFTTERDVHTPKAEPFLRRLASDFAGAAKIAQVDAEKSPRWAAAYNVTGYPTLILFVNGQVRYSKVSGWYDAWANELAAVLTSAIAGAAGTASVPPMAPMGAGMPALAPQPAATGPVTPAPPTGLGRARSPQQLERRMEKSGEAPAGYTPYAAPTYAPPAYTQPTVSAPVAPAQPPAVPATPYAGYPAGAASPAAGPRERRGGMGMGLGLAGLMPGVAPGGYGAPAGGTYAPPTAGYAPPAVPAPAQPTPVGAAAALQPMEVNDSNYTAEVLQATVPVVVYFYSPTNPRPDIDQAISVVLSTYGASLKIVRAALGQNMNFWAQTMRDSQMQPTLALFNKGQRLLSYPADAPIVQQIVNYLLQGRLITAGAPGAAQPGLGLGAEKLEVIYKVEILQRVQQG